MLQILIRDAYYGTDRDGEDYTVELKRVLSMLDESTELHETNIGHGADDPVFLLELFQGVDWETLVVGGAGAVFLLGERIEKNIDAWLKLASRFQRLLAKLKPTRIDEYGAVLVSFDRLNNQEKLDKYFRVTIQVVEAMPGPSGNFRLDKRPDALYIVNVESQGRHNVFGVKSTGEVVFEHDFGASWFDFD